MHSYAVNVPRWKVTGGIAIIAAVTGGLLNAFLQANLPGFVQGLSPFALFTVLWLAFDRWLWQIPFVKRLIGVPNLNGTWKGEVRTSYSEDDSNADELTKVNPNGSELIISQTWSKIEIQYKNPGSSVSYSKSASFDVQTAEPEITYTYINRPEGDGLSSAQTKHEGTTALRLEIDDEERRLVGRYYTDEERHHHGSLRFTQVSR